MEEMTQTTVDTTQKFLTNIESNTGMDVFSAFVSRTINVPAKLNPHSQPM